MPSIDHEAEQHINAQEAEFGADGTRVFQETEAAAAPTIRELHEQYKPIVLAAVMEDVPYRNACGHSDHENAVIEGNAAIRRAVLGSGNMELLRLYSDTPEFRQRLHREIIDETYPKLHELLHPLTDNDIDKAIQDWNGKIESKHAVVRYMEKHGREKDTAAWLAHEFDGGDGKTPFSVRPESPEGTVLPWPKVQRRIAQLIKEDRFYTEAEQDRFDNIDRNLFFKNRVNFISTYHAKRDDERICTFDNRYISAFGSLPTLYSYRGYDAAVLFGSAMFDDINSFFDDETFTPLQTPYRFTRTADGNRVNTEWVRVVYNDNYTITLE